jgi:predicted permease
MAGSASWRSAGFLFRALGRRREIATRVSLGAGRGRLIRQLLTESVLLALLGGVAGLALASWGRSILWALRPPSLPDVLDLSFDPQILAFALGVSLLTGLLFGLVPALQTSRVDLVSNLKEAAAATTGRRSRALSGLVVAQVALSAVLLIGTGLFTRSLQTALSIDPGFAASELLSLSFDLSAAGYDTPRALDFLRRATETAAALPGARSAAVGINPPLTIGRGGRVYDPGRQSGTPDEALAVRTDGVSPGYFQTAGIPLVRGRGFADTDREDGPFIVVINQSLADRVFPGVDPVGRRLGFVGAEELATVVGVVRDAKYGTLGEEPQPFVYFALPQAFGGETTLYVRADGDPAALLDDTRQAIQALDSNLPLVQVRTVSDVIDQSLWAPRAGASLLGFFGLLGLILAAVGVYGVMSYSVDQRRREIGIRMALGEPRRGIVGRVLRRGLGLLIAGLLLGLAAALASARWIAGFLYGVSAHDPVAFATAALVLAAAALLAMVVPARRATTVEPVTVMRSE